MRLYDPETPIPRGEEIPPRLVWRAWRSEKWVCWAGAHHLVGCLHHAVRVELIMLEIRHQPEPKHLRSAT